MRKYRTIEIDSWADYQRLVGGSEFRTWAFRGRQSAKWKLFSTISRYFLTFGVKAKAWSRQDDDLQRLALMQHHGAPTRLLDFTWSLFVAAFFALKAATEPAVPGEPLVMNQRLVAQSATFVVPGVLDRPVERIIESYRTPKRTLAKMSSTPIEFETMRCSRSLAFELEHHWEYNPKTLDVHPDFLIPQRGRPIKRPPPA